MGETSGDGVSRAQAIRALARAVLPLVSIFAIAGLGIFLHHANGAAARELSAVQRPFAPGCGDLGPATTKEELLFAGGFHSFTAVTELLLVTQLGVILFAVVVFVKLLRDGEALLTALIVAGAAATGAALIPSQDVAPTTVRMLASIAARCANIEELLIAQERLGAFAATLLACTLGVVLFRRRPPATRAEVMRLAGRMRMLAAIL